MTTAYVSHGRWVIDCPEGCGNAVLATELKRLYRCPKRKGGCGARFKASLPNQAAEIWALLAERPAMVCGDPLFPCGGCTRNWMPGETLTDLRAENALAKEVM